MLHNVLLLVLGVAWVLLITNVYETAFQRMLAVVLPLAGFALAYLVMEAIHYPENARWERAPILVAADDFSEGTVITANLLQQRDIPRCFITASMVLPDQSQRLMGQVARSSIQGGDPMYAQLAGPPVSEEDCQKECEVRWGSQPTAPEPGAPLAGVRP